MHNMCGRLYHLFLHRGECVPTGCARLIWISWISRIMDFLDFLDYMDFCRIKEMQTAKVASGSRIIPS